MFSDDTSANIYIKKLIYDKYTRKKLYTHSYMRAYTLINTKAISDKVQLLHLKIKKKRDRMALCDYELLRSLIFVHKRNQDITVV